jgi:hypothetical protein
MDENVPCLVAARVPMRIRLQALVAWTTQSGRQK